LREKDTPVANPTIQDVLDTFLEEQCRRLSARTYAHYSQVVNLLLACLNLWGHESLSDAETERFKQLRRTDAGGGREFCDLFGPEHILAHLDHFLGEFMIRKVLGGGDLKRAAGTVTGAVVAWLVEKGHVSVRKAKDAAKTCDAASRNIPRAEDLALRMTVFAQEQDASVEERVEDLFTFTSVQPSWVWVRGMKDNRPLGPIDLPEDICSLCRVDWMITAVLGRVGRKWQFIEAWNVYPREYGGV